ncbi:hypothetical protein LOAG_01233 [Loa loa]|uniref:Uncharacterized protein n=1 Tax=Loa loa TaxID=7209 RepID=A0A1S0UBH3_LOALO|nr:hypothetical protein LOAG_01233 [Loa loa]EFO27251.1 hypothetical protein LOAG_01233 [Loa loa]
MYADFGFTKFHWMEYIERKRMQGELCIVKEMIFLFITLAESVFTVPMTANEYEIEIKSFGAIRKWREDDKGRIPESMKYVRKIFFGWLTSMAQMFSPPNDK